MIKSCCDKVLLQEFQTYARYIMNSGPEQSSVLSDNSYRQSYAISFTVLQE